MKKVVCVLLVFLLLPLTACRLPFFGNDKLSKEEVISLVLKNRDYICEQVDLGTPENCKRIRGISRFYSHPSKNDLPSRKEKYTDFGCGGTGMGGQTTYAGFYFLPGISSMNVAIGFLKRNRYKDYTFTQEDNGYVWRQPDGDNEVYLEWITDQFVYYHLKY